MKELISITELLDLSPKAFTNKCFIGGQRGVTAWNKGLKMPDSFCQKISAAQKGKTVSEITRLRMSAAQKGRLVSETARLNMSKAKKGKVGLLGRNPRARAVSCPAGYFDTIKEAAIAMGCDGGTMRSRIKKGLDGYFWALKKEGGLR